MARRPVFRGVLRRLRSSGDDGVALVMVVGVMLVAVLVCFTLVNITLFSTAYTGQNRVAARVQGAAESGIDLVMSQLEGKKYNELSTVCPTSTTTGGTTVTITTTYTVTHLGSTVPVTTSCPIATDTVQSLKIVSSASATSNVAVKGMQTVTRRAQAVITPTLPQVTLDKALFGEASLDLTNNSSFNASGATDASGHPIADAQIYSNGGVDCHTQNGASGSIYAAYGDIHLYNNCKIGSTIWASGTAYLEDGVVVSGDVYAASASATAVTLTNSPTVTGSVLTNGSITSGAQGSGHGIYGLTFSYGGGLKLTNQAILGKNASGASSGSVYVKGDIALGQGTIGLDAISVSGKITGDAGSSIGGLAKAGSTIDTTHIAIGAGKASPGQSALAFPSQPNPAVVFPPAVGYPSQIQPPAREQFPQILMGATELAKWQSAGWAVTTLDNKCSTAESAVDGVIAAQTQPTVVVFTGCGSTPVSFNNANFTGANALKGDLALVSVTGFSADNPFAIRSSVTGSARNVYLVVPADAPGVSWNSVAGYGQTSPVCNPSRDINFNNTVQAKDINWMIYTPCTFTVANAIDDQYRMVGQIYAGKIQLHDQFKLQMKNVPVPSLTTSAPNLNDVANMRLTARFDLPAH